MYELIYTKHTVRGKCGVLRLVHVVAESSFLHSCHSVLPSVSVRPCVSAWLPLDGFPRNLLLGTLVKVY